MKTLFVGVMVGSALIFSSFSVPGAEAGDPKKDLQQLVSKIQGKIGEGKRTEKGLEPELKEFDGLLARYEKQKTDDVAQILVMKAILYLEVFEDPAKGAELIKKVKADFPETTPGKMADAVLAKIAKGEEAKKIQRSLIVGVKFPDFDEKDVTGEPLSVGKYKGKVVLVDFWATWCGLCVQELPNLLATYQKHHAQGFDVIGISLDEEKKTLTDFTRKNKMPWQQFFDGKVWENKLAEKYGVGSSPTTYLLDRQGVIIAKDLHDAELGEAVASALKKK